MSGSEFTIRGREYMIDYTVLSAAWAWSPVQYWGGRRLRSAVQMFESNYDLSLELVEEVWSHLTIAGSDSYDLW